MSPPRWFEKGQLNPFGALPDWVRTVFRLRDQDVPRELMIGAVVPVINLLDVATRPVAGTVVLAPAPAVLQLPNVPGALLLIQADPANLLNVLLGFGNGNIPIVLPPGAALEASLPNLNLIFVGSAGAGAPVVNWTVLQPV